MIMMVLHFWFHFFNVESRWQSLHPTNSIVLFWGFFLSPLAQSSVADIKTAGSMT